MSQSSDNEPAVAGHDTAVPAGDFLKWLEVTLRNDDSPATAEVPCGDCAACCTSSYFIHIRSDEIAALARIPDEFLVEAPGLPAGHSVMGYDENGHCPMFIDGGCSIYDDRPQTCRDYDCRVFAATGLEPDGDHKAGVIERIHRWEFAVSSGAQARKAAVRMCADFLRAHAHNLPPGSVPTNPTNLAMLAMNLHEIFIEEEAGIERCVAPDIDVVADALADLTTRIRLAP